jgi:hypothetical protein
VVLRVCAGLGDRSCGSVLAAAAPCSVHGR